MARKGKRSKFSTLRTGNPNKDNEELRAASWQRWVDRYAKIKNLVESPIELRLSHSLATLWEETIGGPLTLYGGGDMAPSGIDAIPDGMSILHQYPVDKYRVDFLVLVMMGGKVASSVIVECDGHDFHERTKEQAARDRSRDRDMALTNIRVLRFTGSEIHKDSFSCAEEILYHLGVL